MDKGAKTAAVLQEAGVRHGDVQHAIGKGGSQCGAGWGLPDAGHGVSVRRGQERIPALQHKAWVQQLKAHGGAFDTVSLQREAALYFFREIRLQRILKKNKEIKI